MKQKLKVFKLKCERAFTLIEVLVAMLVLAIGLLGLAGITVVVMKSNAITQQVSDATSIAADLMETLRRKTSLPNCSGNVVTYTPSSVSSANCPIIAESGLKNFHSNNSTVDFYPPTSNSAADCALEGVLDGSNVASSFDLVTPAVNATTFTVVRPTGAISNLVNYATSYNGIFLPTASLCGIENYANPVKFPARTYLRYYKTYLTPTYLGGSGEASSTERTLVVAVFWKDKFGKWRNVHLSTQK